MRNDKAFFRNAAKAILSPINRTPLYKSIQASVLKNEIRSRKMIEPECELLSLAIREGETAVDIGANYGLYAYWLGKAVGASGKVICFEPIPYTFDILQRVRSKLGIDNAELHRKGVGDQSGTMQFDIPVQSSGQIAAPLVRLSGRKRSGDVSESPDFETYVKAEAEVVRLDDFLADCNDITFIKADIEGGEAFALRGAMKLISEQTPTLLLEVNPEFLQGFGFSVADVVDPLEQLGYRAYWWSPHERKLVEMNRNEVFAANYFFIPPKYRERFRSCFGDEA